MTVPAGNTAVSVQTIALKRLEFAVEHAISRHEMAHICDVLRCDGEAWMRSPWADEMVLQIRAAVWCKDLKTESHSYPTTWWDAVKERWVPRWLRRWFPVRKTTVEVTSGIMYPSLPTVGPGYQYGEMHVGREALESNP